MTALRDLLNRYRGRVVDSFNDLYFTREVAIQFVRDCEEANIAILGIEGFVQSNKGLYPQMDLIGDFSPQGSYPSWEEYRRLANESAMRLLAEADDRASLVFIINAWTAEEWAPQQIDKR